MAASSCSDALAKSGLPDGLKRYTLVVSIRIEDQGSHSIKQGQQVHEQLNAAGGMSWESTQAQKKA
jgi:hypothetical protein